MVHLLHTNTNPLTPPTPFLLSQSLGLPTLSTAAAHGANWLVRAMLKQGAQVDAVSGRERSTALHKAARWGHRRTVQLLLEVMRLFSVGGVALLTCA